MRRIVSCLILTAVASAGAASAEDHGRIKRKPPTDLEAERIASEIAMNDSLLKKGDIVVTDRGPLVFLGTGPDGYTYQFAPVPSLPPPTRR